MKYFIQLIIYINRLASRFSLNNFSRFWNFVFTITNNSLRFEVPEKTNVLLLSDGEYKLYISQKIRAWFYFKSIRHRFESLGKMYFLDKVIFSNKDIVIDCGANIGEIYNSIKLFNNNNFYYYGFEPVQSEF